MGQHRLAQIELSGCDPTTGRRSRLLYDYEPTFLEDPDDTAVPTVIVNVASKVNLFRMQEAAWKALDSGETEDARRRLEAVATRLLDRGEEELARVALLEAGRIAQRRQVSSLGRKAIKFGTRSLAGRGHHD
jgi:hypothetical protein